MEDRFKNARGQRRSLVSVLQNPRRIVRFWRCSRCWALRALWAYQMFDGGLPSLNAEDEPTYVNVAKRVLAGEGYTGPTGPTSDANAGLPLVAGTVISHMRPPEVRFRHVDGRHDLQKIAVR